MVCGLDWVITFCNFPPLQKFHWVKLGFSLEINNIPHMTTVGYVKLENKEVEFTAFFRIIIVKISKQGADCLGEF